MMSTIVYEDDLRARAGTRRAAWCACLLMLVALVDSQVVGAITPQIAAGLGSTKTGVASSVMVYALAAAAVALLLGRRRGGRVDPVRWLPWASVLFVGANALAACAPHVALFWAARATAGLAGGLVSALVIAALADASSYARRGRQMSGVAVVYFLAPVVGVPVGAWAAGRFGWRVVFAASAVLVAAAGLLVRQFPLAKANEAKGESTAGEAASESMGDARGREFEGGTQRRDEGATGRASLWRLAMRSRSTRRGIVSAFFVSGGLVGLTTYLGAWLADAFRAGAREVGLTYALAGAGAVVGGALGGLLADRYGKRRVAVWSSALMIFTVLVLPTFAWGARLWAIIAATAFLAALRVAPLQALITELVKASERATYIALRNGASQLGIALAVAAGARLYPRYGLAGVGALCAALTLGATLSMRKLADPHDDAAKTRAGGGSGDERARHDEEIAKLNEDAAKQDEDAARRDDGAARLVATNDAGASLAVATENRARRRLSGRSIARKAAAVLLALVLLVTVGLPWLLSFAITKAGTRPDERRRTDTPAAYGATFEPVSFTSTDGNTLSGWYLPASGQGAGRGVTFVLTHGLFRSRYEMLERGLALWREGYNVLLYDLRRHGASAAEFSTIGYDERHDVRAAYAFARGRAPEDGVVLMGVSMGAAATLLAASEIADDKLLAVVAESSFLSFEDTVRHHVRLLGLPAFPFATLLIKFTSWRLNFASPDYDVLRATRKIVRPVLFIGGAKDTRMPNSTVLEPLYAAAASTHKRKFIVEDATHGHAYDKSPESYIKVVTEFVESSKGR
ncbi:MAG TPA: MFS transporter [Pyrinomonadaceae bacterium]|jgi:predicted MFS family arabinose efflux permease/fermentation-respiration switch protein FrsA (DUF1100 family)